MADLKPCPICNCESKAVELVAMVYGWAVQCESCGCTQGIYDSMEQAVEEWNTRPRENQIKQEYREKCALICDEIAVKHWQDYKGGPNRADLHYQGLSDGADECAIAIRNMEGT